MSFHQSSARRLSVLLTFACFSAAYLLGCSGPQLASAPQETARAPGPFLWEVTGDNGPVYLMGTVHLGVDAEKELPAEVWDALERSSRFVMEADITKVNPLELMKYIQLPPGESLSSKLDNAQWELLKARTARVMPEMVLLQSRPWFINTLLMQMVAPDNTPMDLAFQERARAQGKSLEYLETWEFQILMMNSLPEAYSIDGLVMALTEPEAFEGELLALLDAYRSGEEAQVIAQMHEEMSDYPRVTEMTLNKRNQSWIAPIEDYIKKGDVFVAVGLAHLVGEQSVVALLRQKGYTVERVGSR